MGEFFARVLPQIFNRSRFRDLFAMTGALRARARPRGPAGLDTVAVFSAPFPDSLSEPARTQDPP